jgi:hypothetical protein
MKRLERLAPGAGPLLALPVFSSFSLWLSL